MTSVAAAFSIASLEVAAVRRACRQRRRGPVHGPGGHRRRNVILCRAEDRQGLCGLKPLRLKRIQCGDSGWAGQELASQRPPLASPSCCPPGLRPACALLPSSDSPIAAVCCCCWHLPRCRRQAQLPRRAAQLLADCHCPDSSCLCREARLPRQAAELPTAGCLLLWFLATTYPPPAHPPVRPPARRPPTLPPCCRKAELLRRAAELRREQEALEAELRRLEEGAGGQGGKQQGQQDGEQQQGQQDGAQRQGQQGGGQGLRQRLARGVPVQPPSAAAADEVQGEREGERERERERERV